MDKLEEIRLAEQAKLQEEKEAELAKWR